MAFDKAEALDELARIHDHITTLLMASAEEDGKANLNEVVEVLLPAVSNLAVVLHNFIDETA